MKAKYQSLFSVMIGAAIVTLAVSGCSPKPVAPTGGGPAPSGASIPIGEYGSLSGSTASFGTTTHEGIALAVEQLNKAGGINGQPVNLITEDDRSLPAEAGTAVTKLVTLNHVTAVLGEVASTRSMVAAPICQKYQVPMISPSSTNPKVTALGDYIFRVCFIDSFQGYVMAKFARQTLKLDRVAVLTDVSEDYSKGLAKYFKDTFTKLGGTIVAEADYATGDKDFRAQLGTLKAANPQAIFVPGYYQEVGLIAKQEKIDVGLNVPLLGGDGWDAPQLVQIGGKALEGCYFSDHYSVDSKDTHSQQFVQAFTHRWHEKPNALAALGYDAANLLFAAMKKAGTGEPALRNAIAATRNFPGVTGSISIDAQRNARKSAVVLEVKGGKFVYVTTINPE